MTKKEAYEEYENIKKYINKKKGENRELIKELTKKENEKGDDLVNELQEIGKEIFEMETYKRWWYEKYIKNENQKYER